MSQFLFNFLFIEINPFSHALSYMKKFELNISNIEQQFNTLIIPLEAKLTPSSLEQIVAMRQLLNIILTSEKENKVLNKEEVTELGNYGLQLLHSLANTIYQLKNTDTARALLELTIPTALWMTQQQGIIQHLETIVDILAHYANTTTNPTELAELSKLIGYLLEAVAPEIQSDLDNANPGRPWRLLNINRGIVATRSHNPEVMEVAFHILGIHLPNDAAQFFAEGMEQMDKLNYPAHVRKVMKKYYDQWHNASHTIH